MKTLAKLAAVGASGALLAGIGAGVASAAGTPTYPNGQHVAATVAVDETDSLTLGTNTLDLGHGVAGQHETGAVGFNVSSNDPDGYMVQLSGTDFAGPGSNSFTVGDLSESSTAAPQQGINGALTNTPNTDAVTHAASGATGDNYTDNFALTIPNVTPGSYASTLTYTLIPAA